MKVVLHLPDCIYRGSSHKYVMLYSSMYTYNLHMHVRIYDHFLVKLITAIISLISNKKMFSHVMLKVIPERRITSS